MFDIVTVKSRTGKNEEFMSGGVVYIIDAKKGIKVPREFAALAFDQNALRWDQESGGTIESKVYIEEDVDVAPVAISEEQVKKIKRTSGMGSGKILVDGKLKDMTAIDLNPDLTVKE